MASKPLPATTKACAVAAMFAARRFVPAPSAPCTDGFANAVIAHLLFHAETSVPMYQKKALQRLKLQTYGLFAYSMACQGRNMLGIQHQKHISFLGLGTQIFL
ncbi:MAG: hypothetical protein KA752_12275 [Giesbergeria sp.]|nr:hypothetical protein [Giesbergeria sp.]